MYRITCDIRVSKLRPWRFEPFILTSGNPSATYPSRSSLCDLIRSDSSSNASPSWTVQCVYAGEQLKWRKFLRDFDKLELSDLRDLRALW